MERAERASGSAAWARSSPPSGEASWRERRSPAAPAPPAGLWGPLPAVSCHLLPAFIGAGSWDLNL